MLQNDKIDIFFMGDFNEIEVCEHIKTFVFTAHVNLVCNRIIIKNFRMF